MDIPFLTHLLNGLLMIAMPVGLAIFLAVAALFAVRLFVVFPRVACGHCATKGRCPNAKAMGIV